MGADPWGWQTPPADGGGCHIRPTLTLRPEHSCPSCGSHQLSTLEPCKNVPCFPHFSLPARYHSHITNVPDTRASRCVACMVLPLLAEVRGGIWNTCMAECIACMAKCMRISSGWGIDPLGARPDAWHKVYVEERVVRIACMANATQATHFGLTLPFRIFTPQNQRHACHAHLVDGVHGEMYGVHPKPFGTRTRGPADHTQPVVYPFSQNPCLLARWVAFSDASRPAASRHGVPLGSGPHLVHCPDPPRGGTLRLRGHVPDPRTQGNPCPIHVSPDPHSQLRVRSDGELLEFSESGQEFCRGPSTNAPKKELEADVVSVYARPCTHT
jgi:hypothetical protein